MIEFGGKKYSIDLEELNKVLAMGYKPNSITKKELLNEHKVIKETEIHTPAQHNTEINMAMYDIVFELFDIILDSEEQEDDDVALGADYVLGKRGFSFSLAFNTLLTYNILIEN